MARHQKSHASLLVPQRQKDFEIVTNVSASSAKLILKIAAESRVQQAIRIKIAFYPC